MNSEVNGSVSKQHIFVANPRIVRTVFYVLCDDDAMSHSNSEFWVIIFTRA